MSFRGRTWLKMPALVTFAASVPDSRQRERPHAGQTAIRPTIMPKSPTRLTMNALLAALLALCRSCQKPISRYEQMPTSSQNTNTMATLPAITSPNMLKQNSERYWKKRR